jgi:hypothetical protein
MSRCEICDITFKSVNYTHKKSKKHLERLEQHQQQMQQMNQRQDRQRIVDEQDEAYETSLMADIRKDIKKKEIYDRNHENREERAARIAASYSALM